MFSALEKGAASLNHIAGIAEAEGLADVMTLEREKKIIMIRKQLAVLHITPTKIVSLS